MFASNNLSAADVAAYTVPNPNGYYGCQQNCYQSCGC